MLLFSAYILKIRPKTETSTMGANLLSLFGQLELQRKSYTQLVLNADTAKVHVSPGPQQWSAAQVVYHLVQVDKQVTRAIEKSLTISERLPKASLSSNLRSMLLHLFLKLPLKFKAPKVLGDIPKEVDLQNAFSDWEASRSRLKSILETFPPELEKKSAFRHPKSGMLTIKQTLTFLQEHAAHHQAQLKAALQ